MKKVAVVVLALASLMMLTAVAPTFAKNMHLPEDANAIDYWSGGICVVELTSTWPSPPARPAAQVIRIDARHHEAGTYGAHDSINIDVAYGSSWIPVTYFSTNTDPAFLDFIKNLYKGLPIGKGTGNARIECDLKVERHGNRITAELNTPYEVAWVIGRVYIPTFKLEIDQVGGSLHTGFEEDLTGYSNYNFYEDMMGFDGTSVLHCDAFSFKDPPGTLSPRPYCGITMHGITTYFPPPPA